jgi:hypothetical protein
MEILIQSLTDPEVIGELVVAAVIAVIAWLS